MGFHIVPHRRSAAAKTASIRTLIHGLLILAALAVPQAAQASCTPLASSGQPPAGTTVTCIGTTLNQNGNVGYGDGSQTGLTIDVQPMATVEGAAAGFALGATNAITNDGTISDDGSNVPDVNGIVTPGSLVLTNTSTGVISVSTTDTTLGAFAVNPSTSLTGSNAGLISASANALEATAIQSNAIDFTNTGTISVSGSNQFGSFGILGVNSLVLTNSGTVSADGGTGITGTAVESLGTLNVTNLAGGVISGTETNTSNASIGIFSSASGGGGTDLATISNAGTTHGDDFAIVSFSNTSTTITNSGTVTGGIDGINTSGPTTIDNSGMISGTGRSGVRVGNDASITNDSGGTITGLTGIVFRDPTGTNTPVVNGSVFNAGTITGTGGTAINFALIAGSGPMTLTLGPGSVINGNVLGTGGDTFQLGGTGSDTFDVGNIGPTQQYQGFSTFNKIGASTWTLTGSGTQNWTVASGTLIGDTNSLGGSSLTDNATLEFKQDFDGTFAGVISGSGILIKDGAGTVALTGDNTYSGGTTISGGALQIGGGGTSGSIVGDVVDNGTLAFDRSDSVTFGGVISGSGGVQQLGGGTLTLTGMSTYSGNTLIDAGSTLALFGLGSIVNTSVTADGTFDISSGSNSSIQSLDGMGTVTLGPNSLTLINAAGEFGGVIGGTGGLVVNGGTETLMGDNTYTGGTTISGGTLKLGNGGTSGSITGDVVDNGTLAFDRSDTVMFAGAISGIGTVNQVGAGTTVLTANNSYNGGTTVSSGVLQIGGGGTSGAIVGDVVDNASLVFRRSDTVVFDGAISGTGNFVQLGSGTTILTGNSNYAGGTLISAGTLQFGNGGTSGSVTGDIVDEGIAAIDHSNTIIIDGTVISGSGSLAQIGTGTTILATDNTYTGGTTISAGTLQIGNGGTTGSIVGDVADDAALAFNRSDTITFAGTISGSGAVNQAGTGMTILTGDNTYGGGTTISGGTLQLGNGGTTGSITGDVVADGTLAFDRSDSVTFNGVISGNGTVNQSGSGTTILTAVNTYGSGTFITAGTLALSGAGSIANSTDVSDNGTFDISAAASGVSITSLEGNGRVVLGGNSLTLTSAVGDFGGVISGTGALIVSGGTEALRGDNTYTGGTMIDASSTLELGDGGLSGSIQGDVVDDGTLAFNRSDTVTFTGAISGGGGVAQVGTGATILTSDNTYTGGTTISAGTLQIGNGGTSGSITGDVVDDGTLVFNRSDAVFFSGAISGSGSLVQAGSGTTILTGNSVFTGGTTISAGTLQFGNDGTSGSVTGNAVDNGIIAIDHSNTVLIESTTISGSGSLNQIGGGTTILATDNTYTGGTIIANGTLQLGNGGTTGSIQGDVVDDGTLAFDRSDAVVFSGAISGTGGLTLLGASQDTLTGTYSYSGDTAISNMSTLVLAGGTNSLTGDIVDDGVLVAEATSLALNGTISGGGSLSVTGGTTTLGGNNTYSGDTTVADGTLSISADNNLGTGGLALLDGSTLQLDGSFTLTQTITVAGDPTFDVTDSNTVVVSTPITDGDIPGDVVKTGTGTLQLTADNTYTGSTTISEGVLLLGIGGTTGSIVGDVVDNSSLGFLRSDTVTFAGSISGSGNIDKLGSDTLILTGTNSNTGGVIIAGGTLQVGNGGASGSITGNVSDDGTLAFDRSDTVTVSSLIFGSGSLSQIGSGTTILTGFDTYTGGTTISAGTLQVGNGGTSGFFNGDVLDNGVLAFDRSDFTFGGVISGSGVVDQIGPGTTTLSSDNTYSGGTTIFAGTLQLGSGGTTGSIVGNVLDNGTLAFDRSDAVTFGGAISGSGSVVQVGTGTTILTGADTYTGGTFVNGGTLQLGTIGSAGSVVGPITVSASTSLFVFNSDFSNVTTLTVDNGSAVFLGSSSAAAVHIDATSGANVSFVATATAGQAQISLDHSVASFQNSSSAGNAQFTIGNIGSATFSGMATAANGTFNVGGGGAVVFFGSSTAGNAQINAAGNGSEIEFAQTSSAGNASLSLSQAATLSFANQSNAGQAQIALDSGARLTFSDTSSGGLTTVTTTAGTQVSIAGLTSGGTTIGSINGAGDVVLGANTLTLGGDNSDSTIGGVISGTGGLVKLGTGTTILTGADTYAGGTTISAGTLQIGNGGTTGSIVGDVDDNGMLAFDRTDTVNLSDAISGTGSFDQIGTGTTILTGTNTYTGGTTISAGTLQIGSGGTSGSIVGDIVDNGTFVFDRSDSLTIAGVISGSGSVSQIGSGTTILTGTSIYTGPTAVTSGTLDVNGSIAASALTVSSGATLKGKGTVGNLALATGSTIAPGNSIGTLHVAGNVSFASGAVFQVEANAAGMADLIDATGTATIDHGATVQVTAAPGTYAFGTTYKIVSAAGGVSGTFGGFTLNTAALMGQLVYGADFVDLVLSPADIDLRPFEHTPNEIATGTAVKAGGPLSTIFGKFLALQPDLAFITGALDELSGEIHPSLETDELENTQVVRQAVLDRLRQSTSGDASGLLAPTAAQSRPIVDGLTMWTHVFAETGSVDGDGNAAEIRQNQSGILAGIDAALGNNATLGIGGGYTHSHLNQRASSARGGDDYVIASGGWSDGPFALRAGGSYAWGNRNVTRQVSFPGFAETLTSKEDEHASQLFGEAAYSGRLSDLALEPFAGITWTDAATSAFSETGGSAALSGRGGDSSTAFTSLGLRLATNAFGGDNLAFTPRAALAWQHAFGSLRPQQFVTFEDTRQSLLVFGTAIDADMANVDVGLDAKIGDRAKLAIGYEGLLSSRVHLNTLHAGLSWTF